ncbi:hypothetical protein ABZ442_20070 [Streptomyces triculaminicus]|uniref:hypothetical protein n=1 Tax=Streptomyces triculaminicus TaxID=2816232 RepID=UPI00340F2FFA
MGLPRVLIDAWSWLNYKPVMASADGRPHRALAPEIQATWPPEKAVRRLAAYKLLSAYDSLQAGELAAFAGNPDAAERREFGDPSAFVDTTLAHLLGKTQQIVVPGADHAKDEQATPEAVAAAAAQDRLRKWAETELLPLRMQACERKAVLLGDGVYLLAWDPDKGRVRLRTVNLGLYFPVLEDDADPGDYPTRVHLAWELPEDPKHAIKARLRLITYELAPIASPDQDDSAGGAPRADAGTFATATGSARRAYPWAPDRSSALTCYLTDAEWSLDDLPLEKATFRTRADGQVLRPCPMW